MNYKLKNYSINTALSLTANENTVRAESLNATLVIDVSGSMRGEALTAAKDSAEVFINGLPENSQISIVSFGDNANLVQSPTSNKSTAISSVQNLSASGETALHDGVVTAINNLPDEGRNVVVLLSDGGDTASTATLSVASSLVESSGTRLVAVALETDESDSESLNQLALNGGEVVTVSNAASLKNIYSDLASKISSEYEVLIPSNIVGDSSLRLEVQGTDGSNYVWSRSIVIGDSEVLQAAGVQPEPVITKFDQTFLNSSYMIYIGIGSFLLSIVFIGLLIKFREKGTKKIAARDLNSKQSQIDAFNDLRMGATKAVEAAFTQTDGKKAGLGKKLESAGLGIRSGEFIMVILASVAFFGLIGFMYNGPITMGVGMFLGFLIPRIFLKFKISSRKKSLLLKFLIYYLY